jgi:UDP-2,3-diacylglucosamine pyrophosphatase LpxH
MRHVCHTLIVSDVHLGAAVSRAPDLLNLLKNTSFKRLILLGDIFDGLNFNRLGRKHWELLSYIRRLSNEKRNKEIVWIRGNHDEKLFTTMSHIIGATSYIEYSWESGGKRHVAIHGDQFDSAIGSSMLLNWIARLLSGYVEHFDTRNRFTIPLFDTVRNSLLQRSGIVAGRAAAYAGEKGYDVIFCGHTHDQYQKSFSLEPGKTTEYYNLGCWIKKPATFAMVSEDGKVEMLNYDKEFDKEKDGGKPTEKTIEKAREASYNGPYDTTLR